MDTLQLMMQLHRYNKRQGPGSRKHTLLALQIAGLTKNTPLKVADIGCGTGAQTLVLAKSLDGQIIAIDIFKEFLDKLQENISKNKLQSSISTLQASMEKLPFQPSELDCIWSEGAVYNIGFQKAVSEWKKFLKPNGILAVSEISWTTNSRPKELEDFWRAEYSEIAPVSQKINILEQNGYHILGVFTLPQECWINNYYNPLIKRHKSFLKQFGHLPAAQDIVNYDKKEFALYQKYKDFYSYGFYIAQKKSN